MKHIPDDPQQCCENCWWYWDEIFCGVDGFERDSDFWCSRYSSQPPDYIKRFKQAQLQQGVNDPIY